MGLSTLLQLVLCGITTAIDLIGTKGCTASACVFANPWLRFGTGSQTSINTQGLFVQPFYFSQITNTWYKLTYSNYPLDTAIGTGTTGPNWSGTTVVDLYTVTPSGSINDYSGFTVTNSDASISTGYGRIVTNRTFTINGQSIIMQNIFSLGINDTFVKINNRIYNNGLSSINNVYIWVGTRDDYVGNTDSNMKTRGNIVNGQFIPLTAVGQQSYAIMITNPTEGVLFYSETNGVKTVYDRCCAFSNSYNLNPATASIATAASTDGSYAAVLPLGNIPVGGSADITWYYAAGAISSLSTVVQNVAVAQQEEASSTGTPLATPSETPSYTNSESASWTASETPSWTASETSSISESITNSQSDTQTASRSASQSTSKTSSNTVSQTGSKSASQSGTQTKTNSGSQTASQSASKTSSNTASQTGTKTASQSASKTSSNTASQTGTKTASQSASKTSSNTASQTGTQTASKSGTQTKTNSGSQTASNTASISAEVTSTPLYYITYYASTSQTPIATPSISPTYMITRYPSIALTTTHTPSPLFMKIFYPSISASPKPLPIVVEDKTNYTTQIVLGGLAVTGISLALGLTIGSNILPKCKNSDRNVSQNDDNDDNDDNEKIKRILKELVDESHDRQREHHCESCSRLEIQEIDYNEKINRLIEIMSNRRIIMK